MRFIFQNREDLQSFVSHTVIPEQLTYLIRGSGVDLDEFPFLPEPDAPVSFVLVARMLSDKGVREFVDAARDVRRMRPDWRFVLVGGIDPGNPSSLTEAELEAWDAEGVVEWLGHRTDVRELLGAIPCGVPAVVSRRSAEIAARSIGDRPPDDRVECARVSRSRARRNHRPAGRTTRRARACRGDVAIGRRSEAARVAWALAARERAVALYSIEDVVHDTFLIYDELLRG